VSVINFAVGCIQIPQNLMFNSQKLALNAHNEQDLAESAKKEKEEAVSDEEMAERYLEIDFQPLLMFVYRVTIDEPCWNCVTTVTLPCVNVQLP
jgi:hypothetical protein